MIAAEDLVPHFPSSISAGETAHLAVCRCQGARGGFNSPACRIVGVGDSTTVGNKCGLYYHVMISASSLFNSRYFWAMLNVSSPQSGIS